MKICHTCQQTYSDDIEFCPRDGARLAAEATETEAQLAAGLSRRFRIVRRLGAGGMGTVFLAEQIGVGNRPVALKVLNRKLLDDPDFLMRFQNEAGSTGRISQENIVTIYESAQADDGTPYIAMEFLEGESLRQALQRRGALPVAEVAEILLQAANGLNAAHELGIIHRDLKPDNIFLTRNRGGKLKVKIVDFGIAKLRESAMHTQTGMVLGTPAYMSSEQAYGMRSDELDARSDVYSLGVVVYEMLTGRVPFHSDTPAGFLRKHLMEEPPPFRSIAPGLAVPPAIERAVMKALVKDRDERYASALDFAGDFAGAASPTPQAETSALGPTLKLDPLDRERAAKERLAREKAEVEQREKEKAAAELAAREKAEKERLAREKAEAERREKEKAAAELAAREKVKERLREGAEKRQRLDRLVNEGKGAFDAHTYGKAAVLWREALELSPDEPGLREGVEMAEKAAADQELRVAVESPPFRTVPDISEPQGYEEGTPAPAKPPAVMYVLSQARQVTNAKSNVTPSVIALGGMPAWQSQISALLQEPRYTSWVDLFLTGWIVGILALDFAVYENGMEQKILVLEVIFAFTPAIALATTSRYIRQLGDNPTLLRPRDWAIPLCLLAIIIGFFLDLLIVFPLLRPEVLHLAAFQTVILMGYLLAAVMGLIAAGLRIRCRRFEWYLFFGIVAITMLSVYYFA
jgi:serine/threonine protein kinase